MAFADEDIVTSRAESGTGKPPIDQAALAIEGSTNGTRSYSAFRRQRRASCAGYGHNSMWMDFRTGALWSRPWWTASGVEMLPLGQYSVLFAMRCQSAFLSSATPLCTTSPNVSSTMRLRPSMVPS